jgi:class 3 adenylate cyclase/tetratricopeptide (TPR) repeat protein
MTIELLRTYVPMDRRQALATGDTLPVDATGSVLLADISGFTPLTEALVAGLGPRRGAEELTKLLNTVYTGLVSRVYHFGGSVVCFIGDALISWFPDDLGVRALACGLQMQRAMKAFQAIAAPQGGRVSLAMKAAVAAGPVHRFLIGDPEIQLLDVLAGATVDRLAEAEHLAERGEVIASPEVTRKVSGQLLIGAWRGRFGVVEGLRAHVEPAPWPDLLPGDPTSERLRPYLLRPVHERVDGGQGEFLAELRPVSVLFLRFTGIDYDVDETAGEKLDAFTTWVQGVAGRYGAHVLLLTTADKGSHLYVVFGALEAHEDDRQRAVAAAMALRVPPSELSFISGVQIGVSHGRARVGAYGGESRRTYGALGGAVNLAARLMEAAPVGEIRCSESVYESAKSQWAFDALPAVELKGMDRPQPVYRPRGREVAGTIGDGRDLIGRRAELKIIGRALKEAQAGPRRVLLIEGEAGIGKSRLVEEVRRLASETEFACLIGAADSIEQHTPYRAWRGLLLAFFGLDAGTDPSDQRERVLERVAAIDPTYVHRAPLLNDILGLDLPESHVTSSYDPEVRQESLAALVGELLVHRTAVCPVVLIVEDVHWLDSLSWELSLSVARALANRPVLFVLTHRPYAEVVPTQYATLSAMAGAERLPLGSLPPGETVALAAARLGLKAAALPEAVVSLLTERAEGNPFFAVELIGALRDQDLLVVEGDVCSAVGDRDALRASVPDTLEGVVLSRLDRLPAEEQLTVKVAAVIGRSFLLRTLHHVHPSRIENAELRAHLEHTSRRRLILLEAEDPEPSYAFQHVVTQQVAYDTLLFEQRRELHRSVAGWYERTYAEHLDPHVPLLVVHWNRAGHGEKECEYCRLAGEQAADRHANAEAEIYLTRALELIDELDRRGDSERRLEVLRQRVGILGLLGRVEDERADLARLLPMAEASEEASKRGEARLLWSDFHRRCGQFEESKEQAELALGAMEEAGNRGGQARALTHIGNALEGEGRFQEARLFVQRALDTFCEVGALDGQAASLKSLGVISARLGELPQAMECFGKARGLYRRLGDQKGEADILGNLGALSYYLGEYEKCIGYTEQAQPLFHEMGNRIGSAKCLTNLGNSFSALGAFAKGLKHHEQALEVYEQLEDASGRADSLCNIGIAHGALGVGGQLELTFRAHGEGAELKMAVRSTAEAMALYARIGSQRGEVICHFNLGMAQLCIGETEAAESHLRSALDLSRELGLEHLSIRALSALARARLLAEDLKEAAKLSAEAIDLLGDRSPPEATEVHFTQFRVLAAGSHRDEALPHLEAAHRWVAERAGTIQDESVRDGFLRTYGEVLNAWEKHRATSPG